MGDKGPQGQMSPGAAHAPDQAMGPQAHSSKALPGTSSPPSKVSLALAAPTAVPHKEPPTQILPDFLGRSQNSGQGLIYSSAVPLTPQETHEGEIDTSPDRCWVLPGERLQPPRSLHASPDQSGELFCQVPRQNDQQLFKQFGLNGHRKSFCFWTDCALRPDFHLSPLRSRMLKHDCFHYWMLPFFNATHCLNELHPEHTTQLAVKNRKRFGTHFPLWGKRGSRRKLWLNTDTIKVETERCLALGAACDPAGVSLAGCRDPQFGGL
ncbi:hypothetical protein Anapl_03671 [Anas platyrhynchos]|uniref:Uncharacterized protein n=1 Tax=Anas platyrhynchos TaxID=8839 RepID=R0M1E9_ANAPL|nr:hypothetical protein Anapl_03671 [Anas platyrhynchos]